MARLYSKDATSPDERWRRGFGLMEKYRDTHGLSEGVAMSCALGEVCTELDEHEATDGELNEALASVRWVDPNPDPQDLAHSETDYWEEMRQRDEETPPSEMSERAREHMKELAKCSGCGVLHLDVELYDTDEYLGDGSGRGGRIIDPSCESCIEAMHEPPESVDQTIDDVREASERQRREAGMA